MEYVKPPERICFDGNVSETWKKWYQMFQIFLDAAKKPAKVTALLHCMGEDAIDIYNMEFVPAHGEGDTRVEAENTNDCHSSGQV